MPPLLAAIPAAFAAGGAAGTGLGIGAGAAAGTAAAAGAGIGTGALGAATALGAGALGAGAGLAGSAASLFGIGGAGAASALGLMGTGAGAATAASNAAIGGATSLSSLSTLGTIASGVTSAFGSYRQGVYQKAAGAAQSQELIDQARLEREAAGQQIQASDYKAIQLMSRIKASAGASGAGVGGSAGEIYKTSAQEQQLNDLYTRRSGQLASQRDLYKAALARSEGSQYMAGGEIQAGTGLLTSGVKALNIYKGQYGYGYDPSMGIMGPGY